jgi:hypothetical protein
VGVAAHLLLDAAVDHRHVGDAEAERLAHAVERRVAAADDDAVLHAVEVGTLPSFICSMKSTAPYDAREIFARDVAARCPGRAPSR